MFVNTMPRYEILSPDAIAVLDRGWRRIVSEIGIQFAKPEAVELFAKAGQQVDGDVVKLDPEFVLEQVAKAPREFDVQARNPPTTCTSAATTWCSARCTAARSSGRATSAATPPFRTSAS